MIRPNPIKTTAPPNSAAAASGGGGVLVAPSVHRASPIQPLAPFSAHARLYRRLLLRSPLPQRSRSSCNSPFVQEKQEEKKTPEPPAPQPQPVVVTAPVVPVHVAPIVQQQVVIQRPKPQSPTLPIQAPKPAAPLVQRTAAVPKANNESDE